MATVICLGEFLIDFVSQKNGVTLAEAPGFWKAAGGAPANVAIGLARLGTSTALITKLGRDPFGEFLYAILKENRVETWGLQFTSRAPTALAFVSLRRDGERDFFFYRNPCADVLLEAREIKPSQFRRAKLFHYGTITLISEPSRRATLRALELAEGAGLLLSCDPNLRLPLWPQSSEARRWMRAALKRAHLVKLSEEEAAFVTGESRLERAARQLARGRTQLVIITRGRKGCFYRCGDFQGYVPGFRVQTVDTTGAGDGFVAGLLSQLAPAVSQGGLTQQLSPERLESLLRYANACGALATTQRGAIPALPTRAAVARFLGSARGARLSPP